MATGTTTTGTTPTRGGCSFDDLCRGNEAYYACDNTVDISHVHTIGEAKVLVVERITTIMKSLSRRRKPKKFYIGKTYVQGIKARGKGTTKEVQHNDPSTWKKEGISDRWRAHSKRSYGKDGMVVLAMVTKDNLTRKQKENGVHQEDFAIALEQQLLHHYRIDEPDQRLANETFEPGKTDHGRSAAYVVYMTFGLD